MPEFKCANEHGVTADLMDAGWDAKMNAGECPLCPGSRLRPKLVAKPLDVDTDLHSTGHCPCCQSYFERAEIVGPGHHTTSSFAPGPNTIQPDGTRGPFDPRWYEVAGEEFGQLGVPTGLT